MYTCCIQSFKILASFFAEQAGLNLTWLKTNETFSCDVAHMFLCRNISSNTVNFLNLQTSQKFVIITLKFELCGSTIE